MEKLPDNMDYDTAIANAIIACVPTLTNVLIKNDIKFKIVSGSISDKKILNYLNEYIVAAKAVKTLKTAKVGFVGNSYPGITSIIYCRPDNKPDSKSALYERRQGICAYNI